MTSNIYPQIVLIDQRIQAPPGDDFAEIVALLRNPVLDKHFFFKLDRYDWLPLLLQKKLIDGDAINQHPYRLNYIFNLVPEYAHEMANLLREFQYINTEAQRNFVSILRLLPPDLLRGLTSKLERCNIKDKSSGIGVELRLLVNHVLTENAYRELAWYLTRLLLLPVLNVDDTYRPYRIHLNDWEYGQFLEENRQRLESEEWYPNLLVELLATFSTIYANAPDNIFGFESHTHLRSDGHLDRHSAHDALLQEALRFLPGLTQSSKRFSALWTDLERYPCALIDRLRLLLLAEYPEPPHVYVRSALVDRYAFAHYQEYRDAARAHFPLLSAEDQQLIWSWLSPEPSLNRQTWWAGESLETQEYLRARDYWQQLQRLYPHLPDDLRAQWDELAAEFGEDEEPGGQFYSKEGTASTINLDILETKSIPEVAALVQGTAPATGDPHFDSPLDREEGLAGVIGMDARRRPDVYLAHVDVLRTFPPRYLLSVISSLRTVTDETTLAVSPLLDLLSYATVLSRMQPVGDMQQSRTWSLCVGGLVDLFEDKVMQDDAFRTQLDGAAGILAALTAALGDPDPPPDIAIPNLASLGDPFTRSLNVTRGKVVHALLRFMGWMHEQETEHQEAAATPLLAQAKKILADHFLSDHERSGAVYAAIVRQLPWLLYTDRNYAQPLITVLFDRSKPEVSRSVWSTHLQHGRPYTQMLQLLRDQYAVYARDDLPSVSPVWDTSGPIQESFGQHIGLFFLRGELRFGQDDQILELFLWFGNAKAVARSVSSLNHTLRRTDEDKSSYYPRLQEWWENVLTSAAGRSTDDAGTIRGAVGALVGNKELPLDWRLRQLEAVIDGPVDGSARFQFVEVLKNQAEASSEVLVRSLKLFTRLAQQETDGMLAYQASQLLEQLRIRTEDELTDPINELVEFLISIGYVDAFRDFHR
jgi:hypothetical protein